MTIYFGLNLAYPVGLNDISIVDVLVIAIGFVIRLGAGAVLVEVSLSAWIMICSALLALFLAVAKRRDDVVRALDAGTGPALAGYTRSYLEAGIPVKAKAPCRLARA